MSKIGNDLVQAYEGRFPHEDYPHMSEEEWKAEIGRMIIDHDAKQRLEVYLEWNGILGYSNRIFELATGSF